MNVGINLNDLGVQKPLF